MDGPVPILHSDGVSRLLRPANFSMKAVMLLLRSEGGDSLSSSLEDLSSPRDIHGKSAAFSPPSDTVLFFPLADRPPGSVSTLSALMFPDVQIF